MSYKPVISIILPVYQVEKYIDECIKSILNQSFENFEVICIMDTNSDSSVHKIKNYAGQDDRIKIIHQENRGLSAARNEGIRNALGEYLWFVDSDDAVCDNALSIINDLMTKKKLDMLLFRTKVVYEDDIADYIIAQTNAAFVPRAEYNKVMPGDELFYKMVMTDDYSAPVWLFALRRELVKDNSIYFEEGIYAEDHIYGVLCYIYAKRAICINTPLYMYRVRLDSMSKYRRTGHALYSYVKVYDLTKRVLIDYWENSLLQKALLKICQNMLSSIRRLNGVITREEKLNYTPPDPRIDLIFRELSVGRYDTLDFDLELYASAFVNKILFAKKIVLYGAGSIGELCYKYIQSKDNADKVSFFMVSNGQKRLEYYLTKCVITVNEFKQLDDWQDFLVVISVDKLLRPELEKNCNDAKISNILCVDNTMIEYMRNRPNAQYR